MHKIVKICICNVLRRSVLVNFTKIVVRANTTKSHKFEQPNMATKLDVGTPAHVRPNPAFMKIDTPEFRSLFTKELTDLVALFNKYNYELRIAGGAVRDLLMNITPKDIDFATTATPTQMKQFFEAESIRLINAKGESHGTITARINDKENFEITTLRIDVCTDGRRAKVEFTTDWQLDANRRDLTINSMFLGLDGTVYDYFYGYEDLQTRRIVFVGDANRRIQEDYLRILRYFRFYGRIAEKPNKHDADTLKAIRDNAAGLGRISGERIWSELQRILLGDFSYELMTVMIDSGLAIHMGLPQSPNIAEFRRLSADILNFSPPHNAIHFMAALLDTTEDVMRMHERLKLSAFERDLAFFLVEHRDRVDKDYKSLLDYQKLCVQSNSAHHFVEELLKYCNKKDLYKQLREWAVPIFPLNGNMLKTHGCPPGKKMGHVVNALRAIWADSAFTMQATELLENHLGKVLKILEEPHQPSSPKKSRKST